MFFEQYHLFSSKIGIVQELLNGVRFQELDLLELQTRNLRLTRFCVVSRLGLCFEGPIPFLPSREILNEGPVRPCRSRCDDLPDFSDIPRDSIKLNENG